MTNPITWFRNFFHKEQTDIKAKIAAIEARIAALEASIKKSL